MKISLIVFDLAGTTVKDNQDVHRVLCNTMRKFEVDISLNEANDVMGIPKPVAIQRLLEKKGDGSVIGREKITSIHEHFVDAMRKFYQEDANVGEKDGVSETFYELKRRGIKIYVDTGFDRAIADALLGRMQWQERGLIDGSITSDEVPHGRPHPDMIFKAMELSGTDNVAEVAKVGDTTVDLIQGQSAGCSLVIGVTTGAHSVEDLQNTYHTHLIENIREIERIV
ncbi:MAG TPA: HAD hydrolase-like protein [Ohtaekwangia sp.]|nr:HAD hydrolase-like protein [Ohtaekwangia sp.]